MKLVKFFKTYFEVNGSGTSIPKFVKGSFHPVTDETQRQVDLGHAEVVDAPADADKAVSAAERAQQKVSEAAGAAATLADAAAAAKAADAVKAGAATTPVLNTPAANLPATPSK